MSTYLSAFLSGELDPYSTHAWLILGSIAAEFSVAIGICLESPKEKSCREVTGMILVLGGVIIGAAFTVGLFVFDEGISTAQQRVIAQLETPRKLSAEQKSRIADAIKPFPTVTFVAITSPDAETWDLALDIAGALKADGWSWQPVPNGLQPIDGRPAEGMSILGHIEIQTPPELGSVAKALSEAIREPRILGMADVRAVANSSVKTMQIYVGTKR